ncbi:hypothetical protein DVH24_029964 [Malus domestica]|uniref:Uncharacterized protein n=1 Tax=Malus domestica TaxID=3750 RepID=A0A498I2D3_MALDO|nr:hypothetical protein DVH24_029964 [Malus domestica]
MVKITTACHRSEKREGSRSEKQDYRDQESGKILNLVFVLYEGSELKVDVPVVFKGEDVCPGLKKGNLIFFGCTLFGLFCIIGKQKLRI